MWAGDNTLCGMQFDVRENGCAARIVSFGKDVGGFPNVEFLHLKM